MRVSHKVDWTDFYGDVKEAIPENASEPRVKPIIDRAFVDSDHANDKVSIDPAWDSVSLSIWLVSFGVQRDCQLWKGQFLMQNLLQ